MVDERLNNGLYHLSKATTPRDVSYAWHLMGEAKNDKCVIISLDNYDKSVYPKELNRLINSNDSAFMPYFESDKLYFIDDELLSEMSDNKSYDVQFPIDYSVMLDTNYSSYIHAFVSNDWTGMSNDVFNVIDILIRENFHFDYFFYMIENYNNSFCSFEANDTTAIQNKQAKLYLNLVSLELFKNIDTEEYCNNRTLKYNISEQEVYLIVDGIFSDMYNSIKGKEIMEMFLIMHKSMILILIGVLRIRFESKSNSQNKIQELFEYIDNVVGYYPEREMIIAHKYFSNPRNVQIINKINKGMNEEKLHKSIENIAWDFTVPRIMELFLETIGEGRYFIPFFLSNDRNLRELLRLYKVKGVIFNKGGNKLIPISGFNSREYFKECNVDIDSYFTSEAISRRNKKFECNKKTEFRAINEEFSKLVKVMECK